MRAHTTDAYYWCVHTTDAACIIVSITKFSIVIGHLRCHPITTFSNWIAVIGLFRILGIELELACNQGSCGAIFSHANIFNDIPLHEPPLQASSSSIPRTRIWSIGHLRCACASQVHLNRLFYFCFTSFSPAFKMIALSRYNKFDLTN